MIILDRREIEAEKLPPLPGSHGLLVFRQGKQVIYCIRTNKLERLFSILINSDLKGNPQKQMLEPVLLSYDSIFVIPTKDELESLVEEKRLLLEAIPEYYQKIRLYDQYSYLAINFHEPPYLAVKEDTVENLIYIGPFPDRFFLLETINSFNNILKTPACSSSNYPCSLLDEKRCSGYCLKENKQELQHIIVKNIMQVNKDIPVDLRREKERLENDLKFEKSLEKDNLLTTLEEYYQYLLFFHAIKELNDNFTLNGIKYNVKQGILDSVTKGNQTETFRVINRYFDDYEKRERFALPKESFREMWVLYKNFSALHPEKIDEIYAKSLLSIQEIIDLEV